MTVSFFKILIDLVKIITADWESLTFSGRLDGKLTDSGENIQKKTCSVEWEASGYFKGKFFLFWDPEADGGMFALYLEENYMLMRMCFVSEPQSTTVLTSFLKLIVLSAIYISSVIQSFNIHVWNICFVKCYIKHYVQCKHESHIVPAFKKIILAKEGAIFINKCNTKWKICNVQKSDRNVKLKLGRSYIWK